MATRPADKLETYFEEPGSLPSPRWFGRLVRLGLGLALLNGLYTMLTSGWSGLVDTTPPTHWSFWAYAALVLWVTPPVVNIGFTRNWRRKPQFIGLAVALALVGIDVALFGTWWAPPLGAFVWLWIVYVSAHLGFSFVLAALLATPGCEMRSLPHLWTLLTGRQTREHYCPGFLDGLDRWENRTSGETR